MAQLKRRVGRRERWNPRRKPQPRREGWKHYDKECRLYFEGNRDELSNFKLGEDSDQNCPLINKNSAMWRFVSVSWCLLFQANSSHGES